MNAYTEKSQIYFLDRGPSVPCPIIKMVYAIKYAAARANTELGLIPEDKGKAISETAKSLYDTGGCPGDISVLQTGSGTGINMYINELIAERVKEQYGIDVHPNDHVNLGQSSNDVIPSAIRMAAVESLHELVKSLEKLRDILYRKSHEYKNTLKPGRTHLRDALPTTLGDWFNSYGVNLSIIYNQILSIIMELKMLPLGGTAVGTGINSHPNYREKVFSYLSELTSINYKPRSPPSTGMRLITDLILVSGIIRALATVYYRLSQDIRLMFSGPNTGFNEVDLQVELPGSSIMPGKKNPVREESVMQAAGYVLGLNNSLVHAGLLGELELGMGFPLAGYSIVESIQIMESATRKLIESVQSIIPNTDRMRELAFKSTALVTLLSPIIGYENASKLAKRLEQGEDLEDILVSMGYSRQEIENILSLENLVRPGFPAKKK
ncbi:MAG: fumarate hydratase [Desulfurococcales archaeon]|nr:fumarate hydratase [Desulfurococcales archaeon]